MSDKSPIKQSLWGKFFQTLIIWTAYFLFRPKVIYTDKTLKKRLRGQTVVFVANHTDHFDGPFAMSVMWRNKSYILVKKSWFGKKGAGRAISWCRCIPISLDEADGEWYAAAQEVVKRGFSLFIFPEGGLARNKRLNEFKPGAALISAKMGIPIVPCAIYGSYNKVFGRRQRFIVGEPIKSECPEDMRPGRYARQLIEQAERSVRELYAQLADKYGSCGQYDEPTIIKTVDDPHGAGNNK